MKYVCETCNEDFYNYEDCKAHEESHRIQKLKELAPEGAIVCPTCKGTGDGFGTDGCDCRACYTCDGKKYVKAVTTTVYKPI